MRVLVTGGAGFIGHHLVPTLLARGHDVVVLDNFRRGRGRLPALHGACVIEGDIRDAGLCGGAVAGVDAVVHLAAQSAVISSQSDPDYTLTTNVTGTWNVVTAAREAGVGHVVFASSREVYGEPARLPVCEDAPIAPRNLYGASKAAGEALVGTLRGSGTATSVLRLANVVGTGDAERVVPLWVAAARRGEPLRVFGGRQRIDFVPVGTVVAAMVRVLEGGPVGVPVNIGSGTETSLCALADRVRAETGSDAPIEVLPPRSVEVTRFRADVTRMRELLGIEPPCDPLAGLATFGGPA
ncbi:MAG: SDR family oxidoreductase [Dehalococcoidia bacterium]